MRMGIMKKLRFGFTLAEVLITLGIIGVVAAMTIPNLISNYQKHVVETKLKEDYSILQQMMKMSEESDTPFEMNFPNNMNGATSWFEKYAQPYLKTAQVCYNKAGCWHSKNPTKTLNGGIAYTNHTGLGVGDDIVIVRLNNGSNIIFDGYGQGSILGYFGVNISEPSTIIVFIDANGDNPPNIIGKDIYAAVYTSNGLVAAGDSMTPEEVRENCSTAKTGANAGYYCLKHVKNNGWEIDKDIWKAKVK